MNIVLIGPPGSGKGTQAELLCAEYGLVHISTGNIFREHIKKGTPIGKLATELINKGNMMPDDLTCEVVKERLSREDAKNGFILDGFPRNRYQAERLDEFAKIDYCFNLEAHKEVIIQRICGRLVCRCGAVYNVANLNGSTTCAKCGQPLYHREDDNPETVMHRLKTYREMANPLIDYYKSKNVYYEFDSSKHCDEVFTDIEKVLK